MRKSLLKHYVLDENNNAIEATLFEWGEFFEHPDKRVVAVTHINSQVHVSTVFMGIDHRFFSKGPPILFETMIFGGTLHHHQWRYSSYDDAETGHKAAVRMAQEAKHKANVDG